MTTKKAAAGHGRLAKRNEALRRKCASLIWPGRPPLHGYNRRPPVDSHRRASGL